MKAEIDVTYRITLEVPDNDEILKEYESVDDMVLDIASYRFNSVHPMMKRLTAFDCQVENVEITEL